MTSNKQEVKSTISVKNKLNAKNSVLTVVANVICWSISIFCLLPLIWLFYSSLKTKEEFLLDTLALPQGLYLDNYPRAFDIGDLWTAMGNSAFYTSINVVLVGITALIVGYFMNRFTFKGKKFIYYTYMLGMLIPLYALLVPVFTQYHLLDMLNTRIVLIITYFAVSMPLAIFLYESFVDGIPYEIDEASTVDGCNLIQRILLIIMPLCRPIMATVAILTLLHTWNEYAFASILTTARELRTVSVALRSYNTGFDIEYNLLMTGLFSASLPVLVGYTIFSKQVVKGMTAGAVKG